MKWNMIWMLWIKKNVDFTTINASWVSSVRYALTHYHYSHDYNTKLCSHFVAEGEPGNPSTDLLLIMDIRLNNMAQRTISCVNWRGPYLNLKTYRCNWRHPLSTLFDKYSRTILWCWNSYHPHDSCGRNDCVWPIEQLNYIRWYLKQNSRLQPLSLPTLLIFNNVHKLCIDFGKQP